MLGEAQGDWRRRAGAREGVGFGQGGDPRRAGTCQAGLPQRWKFVLLHLTLSLSPGS